MMDDARIQARRLRERRLGEIDPPVTYEMARLCAEAEGARVTEIDGWPGGPAGEVFMGPDGAYVIRLSLQRGREERLWDLMVGLGYVCERRLRGSDVSWEIRSFPGLAANERWAQEFAGEFLMPGEKVVRELDDVGVPGVASRYGVPRANVTWWSGRLGWFPQLG